jgi:2-polyprenyl-3-methyl-5-hydroxy-6-metoxy-1,4-benzoquinol methylase
MSRRARRRVKDAILRSRFPFKGALARGYLRTVEYARTVRAGRDRRAEAGGLAMPPPRLRVLVAGTADLDRFLDSGEAQARYLRELVDRVGCPLAEMNAILDFGCGCGRIARWFSDLPSTRIEACDYNEQLVGWCDANLDFVHARTTGLAPPLPY